MSKTQKDQDAEALIDAFAAQLLALNDGKAIPVRWQKRLTDAVRNPPATMTPAKAKKHARDVLIVKQLALNEKKIRVPRTKHHNPAVAKAEIAAIAKVNKRTVERIHKQTPDELGQTYVDGMVAALDERLDTGADSLTAMLKAEQQARKAKHDQLVGSPPKKPPRQK